MSGMLSMSINTVGSRRHYFVTNLREDYLAPISEDSVVSFLLL
jgi:hypothetical protein